jgi:hypothetical protein
MRRWLPVPGGPSARGRVGRPHMAARAGTEIVLARASAPCRSPRQATRPRAERIPGLPHVAVRADRA